MLEPITPVPIQPIRVLSGAAAASVMGGLPVSNKGWKRDQSQRKYSEKSARQLGNMPLPKVRRQAFVDTLGHALIIPAHSKILSFAQQGDGLMAANVAEFTDSNFQSEVLQAQGPVLVDFW